MLSSKDERETQPTLGFQRVLQRAVFHVQSSGKKEVTGANVLVAIFGERESQAVYFLNRQDVTRLDVVNYISHGISKVHDNDESDSFNNSAEEEEKPEEPARKSPLEAYATHLNQQARLGKIDPSSGAGTRSSARSRSCAGAARTIRCSWAKRGSARPRSWRGSRR